MKTFSHFKIQFSSKILQIKTLKDLRGGQEKVGLKIEEAPDRTRWKEGVRAIAEGMRCIRPLPVTRKEPD